MQKQQLIGYGLAALIGLGFLLAPIYPCDYWEDTHLYVPWHQAGYGYHSLAEVLGNGFFWTSQDVPIEFDDYRGNTSASYFVVGQSWISLLFIPIFMGLAYLGWLIAGGPERYSILLPRRKNNS